MEGHPKRLPAQVQRGLMELGPPARRQKPEWWLSGWEGISSVGQQPAYLSHESLSRVLSTGSAVPMALPSGGGLRSLG